MRSTARSRRATELSTSGEATRARGLIGHSDAARRFGIDARVLVSLHERGIVSGERAADRSPSRSARGQRLWLSRRDLAAWLFSRPRCAYPECNQRVKTTTGIRCREHRGAPLQRTCDTCGESFEIVRIDAAHRGRFCSEDCRLSWLASANARPHVQRVCESCGEGFEIQPWKANPARGLGRFCSQQCLLDYLNSDPAEQCRRLQEGHAAWASARKSAVSGLDLITLSQVPDRLPREVRRSLVPVWQHMRMGGLLPRRMTSVSCCSRTMQSSATSSG